MNHETSFFRRAGLVLAATLLCLATAVPALAAGTLDKARDSGKLTFGYRADTPPFSFNEAGKPAGFSVALCQRVADAVKAELKLPALDVAFVPVTAASRFEALRQGQIDLVCGTSTPTLERRATIDFSIPIFNAGTSAVMRADTARRMRDAVAGRPDPTSPIWRGSPGALTENVVFATVGGTTVEKSLIEALHARRIIVTVQPVANYKEGLEMVLDRRAAALFGNRPVLLDGVRRSPSADDLFVVRRTFTREPLALAMRRGDDEFRLLVDRSLSGLFRSKDLAPLYTRYFGEPDLGTAEFFQSIALPD